MKAFHVNEHIRLQLEFPRETGTLYKLLDAVRSDDEFPLNEAEDELVGDILAFIEETHEEKAAQEDIP